MGPVLTQPWACMAGAGPEAATAPSGDPLSLSCLNGPLSSVERDLPPLPLTRVGSYEKGWWMPGRVTMYLGLDRLPQS